MKKLINKEDMIIYVNNRFAVLVAERQIMPEKIPEEKKLHSALKQLEGRIKELKKLRKWVNVYVNSRDVKET